MARAPHVLETNWQLALVNSLQEKINAIDDWLDHTADLVDLFVGDENVLKELRAISSVVRMRKNDITDEIGKYTVQPSIE